jgi:hypothetical protein
MVIDGGYSCSETYDCGNGKGSSTGKSLGAVYIALVDEGFILKATGFERT